MKQIILVVACMLLPFFAFSQAKKPTIMIVPSDNWCNQNGYVQTYDNQGKTVVIADYKRALQDNSDLLLVISKINELMAERGFPLKNLESCLKTIENQAAEDALLTSKDGNDVAESPIDKLKKTAKADIWIQINWTVNAVGPKRSITFNLQGLDAYTDKQIAGASGTSAPSFTNEIAILLEESILGHIDNFNSQLQSYFEDLFTNGREVSLRIKVFDNGMGNLESEYDGMELSEIIETWVSDNTVEHRFSLTDATENMMLFEQVRIPLFDNNERPMDTRRWARDLMKHLKNNYQIESKLMTQGLGQAQLVIGSK